MLLIIGQDLTSVTDYVESAYFPVPGGITTYISFYSLLSESFPAYGALGQDVDGDAYSNNVNWGAGPLSAHSAAVSYPGASLVIGLNIAEGDASTVWAQGGLADIGVGAYDANIRRLARFCKSIQKQVYLRIGYEFDGAWNRGYEKYSSYIYAYRRIVDVMREQGVTNVAYVWQASASPVDDIVEGRHENIMDWYPGDEYVDWMGLSWFLSPGSVPQPAPDQTSLANEVISFARRQSKPVMIAEAAPQGFDLTRMTKSNISVLLDGAAGSDTKSQTSSQIWDAWFAPFFSYIHANADVIRAVAYINADWNSQAKWSTPYNEGYWGDSRVQHNPVIRQHWLREIGDTSFWLHGGPDLQLQLMD
ncbi:MAG: glycosyl hydrolase [Gammaproteobacteria bacterium]